MEKKRNTEKEKLFLSGYIINSLPGQAQQVNFISSSLLNISLQSDFNVLCRARMTSLPK